MLRSAIRLVIGRHFSLPPSTLPGLGGGRPAIRDHFPSSAHTGPITGRLVLAIAKTAQPEPRLLISPRGPALFAIDLDQLAPSATAVIDDKALGYPVSLADVAARRLFRAGRDQRLRAGAPLGRQNHLAAHERRHDRVLQQRGRQSVQRSSTGAHRSATARSRSPSITSFRRASVEDTEWIKHVKFQSPMLTKFWGRPIYITLGAAPEGLRRTSRRLVPEHLHARTRPDAAEVLDHAAAQRRPNAVNPATGVESGYATYQEWSGDGYPRSSHQPRAADTVLPRFVFCELGEQWSVRRRGRPGNDSVSREAIPNHCQAVRAAAGGRVDQRVAVAGAAAQKSVVLRRRVDLPARSDRLHALSDDEHLHGLERVSRSYGSVHVDRALLPAHDRRTGCHLDA